MALLKDPIVITVDDKFLNDLKLMREAFEQFALSMTAAFSPMMAAASRYGAQSGRFTSPKSNLPEEQEVSARARTLFIEIQTAVAAKYNGTLPIRMELLPSDVMDRWYMVKLSIPGMDKLVPINSHSLSVIMKGSELALAAKEEIIDSVLYAIFLMLDEDEDEED